MTSHNKPVSTIIEKANRTSCHRKKFIYANNRQKFAILRAQRKAQNLLSEPQASLGFRFAIGGGAK